jgi:hypothetical protein
MKTVIKKLRELIQDYSNVITIMFNITIIVVFLNMFFTSTQYVEAVSVQDPYKISFSYSEHSSFFTNDIVYDRAFVFSNKDAFLQETIMLERPNVKLDDIRKYVVFDKPFANHAYWGLLVDPKIRGNLNISFVEKMFDSYWSVFKSVASELKKHNICRFALINTGARINKKIDYELLIFDGCESIKTNPNYTSEIDKRITKYRQILLLKGTAEELP